MDLEMAETCDIHNNKPITSHCKRHGTSLCMECLLQSHKNCADHIIEIDTSQESQQQMAGKLVSKFGDLSEGIELWIERGTQKLHSLEDIESRLVDGIRQIRQKLIEQINAVANEALELIGLVVGEEETIVEHDIKDLQCLNNRMVKIHETICGLRNRKTTQRRGSIITTQQMHDCEVEMNTLEDIFRKNKLPNRNVKLMFYLSKELESARTNLTSFGELCVEDVNQYPRRLSRPFSFSINRIPSEMDFIQANADGIDTSIFALSGSDIADNMQNMYCSLNDKVSQKPHPKPPPPPLPETRHGLLLDSKTTVDIRPPVFIPGRQNTAKTGIVGNENVTLLRSKNMDNNERGKTDSGFESISQSHTGDVYGTKYCKKENKNGRQIKSENDGYSRRPVPTPRKNLMLNAEMRSKSALDLTFYGNAREEIPELIINDDMATVRRRLYINKREHSLQRSYSDSFKETTTRGDLLELKNESFIERTNRGRVIKRSTGQTADPLRAQLQKHVRCQSHSIRPTTEHTNPTASASPKLTEYRSETYPSPNFEMNERLSNGTSIPPTFTIGDNVIVQRSLEKEDLRRRHPAAIKRVKSHFERIRTPISHDLERIRTPISHDIRLRGSDPAHTRKGVTPLITGVCVTQSGMFFICDTHEDRVQIYDTNGLLKDESYIISPFGCRHIGNDIVVVTSRNQKSVVFFNVLNGKIHRTNETVFHSCQTNELFGIGYSNGHIAVCCLNRIMILSIDNNHYTTVRPLVPGHKSNKNHFEEVMFAALHILERELHVFACDNRKENVSCTNVQTNMVLWSAKVNGPKDIIVRDDVLLVAGKMRILFLRPVDGQTMMEIRAGVPKRPFTIAVHEDTIYLTKKSKSSDKARTIAAIQFKGIP